MLNLSFSSFIKWDSNADFSILDVSLPGMTQSLVLGFLFSKQSASPASHSHLPPLLLKHRLKVYAFMHFPLERLSLALGLYCQLPIQLSHLDLSDISKWNFILFPNPASSLPRCSFPDVPTSSVNSTTSHSVIHVKIGHLPFIFFSSLTSTFHHLPSSMDLDS